MSPQTLILSSKVTLHIEPKHRRVVFNVHSTNTSRYHYSEWHLTFDMSEDEFKTFLRKLDKIKRELDKGII